MQMAHVVAADQEMQYEFFTFKSIFHINLVPTEARVYFTLIF